jgi:hypothetical protein
VHPFWQARLPWLDMPAEPALEAFIQKYALAPATSDVRASMASQSAVSCLTGGSKHASWPWEMSTCNVGTEILSSDLLFYIACRPGHCGRV